MSKVAKEVLFIANEICFLESTYIPQVIDLVYHVYDNNIGCLVDYATGIKNIISSHKELKKLYPNIENPVDRLDILYKDARYPSKDNDTKLIFEKIKIDITKYSFKNEHLLKFIESYKEIRKVDLYQNGFDFALAIKDGKIPKEVGILITKMIIEGIGKDIIEREFIK